MIKNNKTKMGTDKKEWWRPKVGRPRIYNSPEELWQDCVEYFEETDARKWVKKDWVGKDADEVLRETETPYTLTGLFVSLDIGAKTWFDYKQRPEFSAIITRVEAICTTQKVEGALVGAFAHNLVARLEGIKEQTDVNLNDARKDVAGLFPLDEVGKTE